MPSRDRATFGPPRRTGRRPPAATTLAERAPQVTTSGNPLPCPVATTSTVDDSMAVRTAPGFAGRDITPLALSPQAPTADPGR
ncbi:hypothetical protein MZC64_18515 [Crossiella sp. S99.2]|nr:hypothetical protein [Crossiella sp. S99.2]MCK2252554.1 hypothetical protein [Crossiella sp. S99.1]